jgi:sigma-B regulation protein RsbQ
MGIRERNNVKVSGSGARTLMFAHGFGCDQNMWRFLIPALEQSNRLVLFDLVGAGRSDSKAYDPRKYSSLDGYAEDVIEIIEACTKGNVVFVGHSVSAMIGMLADLRKPGRIAAHVMIGPSPCYFNDGDYRGGFEPADIESLLDTMDENYLGWSSTMAPAIMGAPDRPELGAELTNSFCQTDPDIAKQFARVTFTSDNRADLERLKTPALILQCSDDLIAPLAVGDYLHDHLVGSQIRVIQNVGHCPHLSEPQAIADAITEFLSTQPNLADAR